MRRCDKCKVPLTSEDNSYPHEGEMLCKICWFDIPRPGTKIEIVNGRYVLRVAKTPPAPPEEDLPEQIMIASTELARLRAVDDAWRSVRAKHCDPACNWMDIMLETDRQITYLDSMYPIPPTEVKSDGDQTNP